ncbi:efflux RND transporter periplasmic adaptor subunit [Aliikangiella sp. IMCC44359]|uniref:efflux RND transporter periplasmic adaptor subunit n=1 Tax=Aliikangiella sp. IMCC44359 TaxID=3459125 RepID=UPI00403AB206
MNNLTRILIVFFIGLLSGVLVVFFFSSTDNENVENKDKPLYWVAPMDPEFKRNEPGKSPMGMDLIPVYVENKASKDNQIGVVSISPEVVNNLGVRTALVTLGSLSPTIRTVGYVRYDEDQLVHVHPRVEGWIEKLHVKAAGDPVLKGQPLYQIYSPTLVNAQEEFLLAIERKNQRLIKAAEERLKALQLPEDVLKSLKKTRKVQQNIMFYAPQDGVVDNLNIREGFFVKPGTTLMSIGTLKQVWVEAEVFERQAFQVATGDRVTMSLDFIPSKIWEGHVDYIYPTLNPENRTLKVRLRFDNHSGELKPNMFAQVIIHNKPINHSLMIPREAVIRTANSNRVVLALGNGQFQSVEVMLGRFDEAFIEVVQGLKLNETVVVSAQFLLDSESNKNAGLKRMSIRETDKVESASVKGVINNIMTEERLLNISREAIKKWNREADTMDFIVQNDISLEPLSVGMQVQFTFHVSDDRLIISSIEPLSNHLNSGFNEGVKQ